MAEETQRVVMNWPSELKDQVREVAGQRGITDFVVKAVNIHLKNDADVEGLEAQLDQARHFTQELADQLVLGGGPDERLQFLMELEFPDWIQTQGWPEAYASRVRPHEEVRAAVNAKDETRRPDGVVVEPEIVVTGVVPAKPITPDPPMEGQAGVGPASPAAVVAPGPLPPSELPHDAQGGGDDLLARLKASGKLVVASEISKPEEQVVQKDLCPTCNEQLIDGECWTCG